MDRKLLVYSRLIPLAVLWVTLPCHAVFKVLAPDGKVTYTDRPPRSAEGKVTPINESGNAVADVSLPLELRQPVSRYPAMLFVIPNCVPCDDARALLRRRGIPYAEKIVSSNEDTDALQRLTGARDAPTLMLGSQVLRGLSAELWNSYLDSAGYPQESRLPSDYQYPPATPLTEHHDATRPSTTPAATAPRKETEPAAGAPENAPGIKF